MIENKSLQSIDNSFQNNNINLSSNIINISNNNIISPIINQLIEFGFNPLYSRRIFLYYHPQSVEDALEYLSLENGVIQHNFVQDRINNENNICYLCGENKNIHLNSNINNSIISNINILNRNSYINLNNNIENKDNIEDKKSDNNKDGEEDEKIENNNENNIKNKNKVDGDKISFQNNTFIFNLNDTFELLKKKKERKECNACLEMFCPNDYNTLKPCKHSFCNDCWYKYLSIKILENKLTSIKCLDYECQEKPDDIFILNLLYSNTNLIEKYKKFKMQLEIINDPNKKSCPFPNCDSYLELKDDKNKYVKYA